MTRAKILIAVAALLLASLPLAAQEEKPSIPELPVLFTARVTDIGAPVPGASPVYLRMQIERLSTPEQVLELVDVLAEKDQTALYKALSAQPSAGWLTVDGNIRAELRVVRWLRTEEGTMLRVVTNRPLWIPEVVYNVRTTNHPFAVVEINFGPDGSVTHTTLMPAVRIKFNADGTLGMTSFGTQPFRLINVKQQAVKVKKK